MIVGVGFIGFYCDRFQCEGAKKNSTLEIHKNKSLIVRIDFRHFRYGLAKREKDPIHDDRLPLDYIF